MALFSMSISREPIALFDPAGYEQETLRFLKDFGFDGEHPSLDHIAAVSRYFSRLPYENISKILKRSMDKQETLFRLPEEVIDDHFSWHAGGTCFSLTYFLVGIYRVLGYEAEALICSLNWGSNNHAAVQLNFNGRVFLIDPGYMIFKPLPLEARSVQNRISADTGISLRFQEDSDTYALYTFRNNQFIRRYQFENRAVPLEIFSKHWKASFELPGMNELTLTRVSGYEMLFIQGDFIKITSPEQIQKLRESDTAERLIREKFRIPEGKLEEAKFILKQRRFHHEN